MEMEIDQVYETVALGRALKKLEKDKKIVETKARIQRQREKGAHSDHRQIHTGLNAHIRTHTQTLTLLHTHTHTHSHTDTHTHTKNTHTDPDPL